MSFYTYITDATYWLIMEARMEREKKKFDDAKIDAAYSYESPNHLNCYDCCQSDADYERAFVAGADWAKSYLKAEDEKIKCVSCCHLNKTDFLDSDYCENLCILLEEIEKDSQTFSCSEFKEK